MRTYYENEHWPFIFIFSARIGFSISIHMHPQSLRGPLIVTINQSCPIYGIPWRSKCFLTNRASAMPVNPFISFKAMPMYNLVCVFLFICRNEPTVFHYEQRYKFGLSRRRLPTAFPVPCFDRANLSNQKRVRKSYQHNLHVILSRSCTELTGAPSKPLNSEMDRTITIHSASDDGTLRRTNWYRSPIFAHSLRKPRIQFFH